MVKSHGISNRLLGNIAIVLFVALAIYFIWDGILTHNFWAACPGISLLMVLAAFVFLKRPEDQAEKQTMERIKREFSPEVRIQVLEIYERLRAKSLEGSFPKILDDARGNLSEVKKLAGIAESVGTKSFLENHW